MARIKMHRTDGTVSEFVNGRRDAWPENRVALLRSLWPRHSATEIAKTFGCGFTRNAIIGKAHRLGLEKAQSTEGKRRG